MPGRGYPGRGSPIAIPKREVPTLNGAPELDISQPNTKLSYPGNPYSEKNVFSFEIDLGSTFTDREFAIQGTIVYFSGQDGGTAAPMRVKFNRSTNDAIPIHFGDAISGIPFNFLYISNDTAQFGVTATITVILDSPKDRVAIPN